MYKQLEEKLTEIEDDLNDILILNGNVINILHICLLVNYPNA